MKLNKYIIIFYDWQVLFEIFFISNCLPLVEAFNTLHALQINVNTFLAFFCLEC